MLFWPSRKGHNHVPHDAQRCIFSLVTTLQIRQAFCISMSSPPAGVNAQDHWPGGTSSRTYSLYYPHNCKYKIKQQHFECYGLFAKSQVYIYEIQNYKVFLLKKYLEAKVNKRKSGNYIPIGITEICLIGWTKCYFSKRWNSMQEARW